MTEEKKIVLNDVTVEKLVLAFLKEQRSARRWGIFFKLLFFVLLLVIALRLIVSSNTQTPQVDKPHTALITLEGTILPGGEASADHIIPSLEEAYENPNVKGIILKINSPGGAAVQSNLIATTVMRLKKEHPDIPVITVVDEICASGGYYIAAVTDAIYTNPSSLIGSIGVKLDMFGLTGTMEKAGVERRLLVAGEHKGFMDPFSPMTEWDKTHAQRLLDDMHQQFIDVVRQGRGKRLKESPELFSGLVWTGRQSVEMGLVDGLGDTVMVAEQIIKQSEIVDYTPRESVAERLAKQLGAVSAMMTEQANRMSSRAGVWMLY